MEGQRGEHRPNIVPNLNTAGIGELVPISCALEKSVELEEEDMWSRALEKVCPGLSGETPVTPVLGAQQFYRELQFVRALEELK